MSSFKINKFNSNKNKWSKIIIFLNFLIILKEMYLNKSETKLSENILHKFNKFS